MNTVDTYNFSGKKALVRVDFNVPLDENYKISDDTRLKATLPTIKKIINDGGSAVLMAHLGRPKGEPEEKFSLKHVVPYLKDHLNTEVDFADNCVGEDAKKKAGALQAGQVLMLENLRFHNEEKKGDKSFAKQLAELGDVYVNDAFGAAHRAHASTSIVAKFFSDKMFGYVMKAELENANKVLGNPASPYTAIMGGAKISDKIEIINTLLDRVDNLLIGGAMAYTFFKAKGGNVAKSMVEEDKLDLAKQLIKKAEDKGIKLLLPKDSVIASDFSNSAKTDIADNMNIPEGFMGLDIGPEAREEFTEVIEHSKTVLWNGPMGVFEMSNFANGTIAVAEAVKNMTDKGGYSLIGGGDSAAAVNNLGFSKNVSYVSTGGGALLEYMEGKELPGVTAIEG